jgi:hypothetical protein
MRFPPKADPFVLRQRPKCSFSLLKEGPKVRCALFLRSAEVQIADDGQTSEEGGQRRGWGVPSSKPGNAGLQTPT